MLTSDVITAKPKTVGRSRINDEQAIGRFKKGTLKRIVSVLGPDEKQSDFIRKAIEAELERRGSPPPPEPTD